MEDQSNMPTGELNRNLISPFYQMKIFDCLMNQFCYTAIHKFSLQMLVTKSYD